MNPIIVGTGFAPAVTIVDGKVYVAYGTIPHAVVLVTLTTAGVELDRETLLGGFDQSYPRFDGPWLTYRQDETHGYAAVALNVVTRQFWAFGAAGGTYCLAVNAALGLVAYEWKQVGLPWFIELGRLSDGMAYPTSMSGAPDGLDSILAVDRVTLRKDTRNDVAGMYYPVRSGDMTVGERPDRWLNAPPEGAAALLDGQGMRIAFLNQNAPTPRCATDGSTYAIVTGGDPAVRLWLGSQSDVLALSLPSSAPMPVPPIPPQPPTPAPPVPPVPKPPAPPLPQKPKPAPEPEPAPKEPVMPLPDYAQFVTVESWEVERAYKTRTGHSPAISDQYHNAYRRLVEMWTHRDILHDILGQPLEDGGAGGNKAPVNP